MTAALARPLTAVLGVGAFALGQATLRPRLIPCLLLQQGGFVKTRSFKAPRYIGDPLVTVRLFNEKEADELVILDIAATRTGRGPSWPLLEEIAGECFMPLAYGGGLDSLPAIERALMLGIEKVVLTTAAVRQPELIAAAVARFGSQSIVGGVDAHRSWLKGEQAMVEAGRRPSGLKPVELATRLAELGVGEILLQSIDRDGTKQGYDLDLVRRVADAVAVPVVACGGAGSLAHVVEVIREAGASAAAAGSLFVFKGRHDAVLINMPSEPDIHHAFSQTGSAQP